jgi:phospholipid-translocating ATPase
VEGLVVYAGHETKAMLNNSGPRYKRSQVEQQMNLDVIWCVCILVILCIVGAIGNYMWSTPYPNMNATIPYLPDDIDPLNQGFLAFWRYVILLQVSFLSISQF